MADAAALALRLGALAQRLAALEARAGDGAAASPAPPPVAADDGGEVSPVHARLRAELTARGVANARFVRAPPDYYERPLEARRDIVGAAHVDELCKSIIMENTRLELKDGDPPMNPGNVGLSKYFLVVVQYVAKLHSERLNRAVVRLSGGALSKSGVNLRLCPEAVSDALTGFEHNAVSPVGCATRLPILLSHRAAALDFFWLGAGETDLKVGMPVPEFVDKYVPHVVECTYD